MPVAPPDDDGHCERDGAGTTDSPQSPSETNPSAIDPKTGRLTEDITVIAQDRSVTTTTASGDKLVLTAKVTVPREVLEPGPRTHRFYVVDHDTTAGVTRPPSVMSDDVGDFVERFAGPIGVNGPELDDPAFHAQNVYAIAARTLSLFEKFLGRRVPWAFDSHQLHLVPNAEMHGNAYYDKDLQAVLFGYVHRDGGVVRSCLSHDVVAHEVTHAILDGQRPRYLDTGWPDQAAFHEGLADLVALLSVFGLKGVLKRQLTSTTEPRAGNTPGSSQIHADILSEKALESTVLYAVAEELGRAAFDRRAVRYVEPLPAGGWWRDKYVQPHQRCTIVVAAVMKVLSRVWYSRLRALIQADGWLDLDAAVTEGTETALHVLGMMIRALDVLPPVELEFEDVVDAVIVADRIANPEDPLRYRDVLKASFAYFDICEPAPRKTPLSRLRPRLRSINFRAMRSDRDEMYRFIWQNTRSLDLRIDLGYRLLVTRVRGVIRIGDDGLAVEDIWADYVQQLCIPAGELSQVSAKTDERHALKKPDGVPDEQKVTLWGGGVIVLDQFGRLRWHKRKGLAWEGDDIVRQQRRLDYLAAHGLLSGPDGMAQGYSYLSLHPSENHTEEMW